jgi:hypothetical protein
MKPWYAPIQVAAALGITVPFFIYYAWRFYSLVLEHHQAYRHLSQKKWIHQILVKNWNQDEMTAQLSFNCIALYFDKKLVSIRLSLRVDAYNIILIGFIGTLMGMIASFTTLLTTMGNSGLNPGVAIATLIRGGLSTALISSLIAAIMAAIVMGYLSITERKLVKLKYEVGSECLAHYRTCRQPRTRIDYAKPEVFNNRNNFKLNGR